MKVCLLGYQQSGKKTLFTLLTGRKVLAPLKEKESLEGCAHVRDPRVDSIARLVNPEKIKYAEIRYVLCPDVETGSQERPWLEEARKCDSICIVVRDFVSDLVYHPAGTVDFERDKSNLMSELVFADLEIAEKRLERISKEKKGGQNPEQAMEEKALVKCRAVLEQGKYAQLAELEAHEEKAIRGLGLLTFKPVLCVRNIDEDKMGKISVEAGIAAVSCKIEQEIMEISDPAEREEYLKSAGLSCSGLDRVNSAIYDSMGLMSFYTMGKDEVRAWTIKKGSPAPVAAGKIHTDMERGFIRAEVIRYDELMQLGSESAVKEHGKVALKGKDYIIQDGDICSFLFNV